LSRIPASKTRAAALLPDTLAPIHDVRGLALRGLMIAAGVLLMTLSAKIRIPMWPVPVTMQTFAVITLGAVMGARMGLLTLLAYLTIGALGADVFTASGRGVTGLAYLTGPTAGYLLGFAVAAWLLGRFAERGYDRSVGGMALAAFAGTVAIYALGLAWMGWLFAAERGWDWVVHWGLVAFLPGEALKLALAALLLPALRRVVPNRN